MRRSSKLNLNATATIRLVLEPTSLNPFSTAGAGSYDVSGDGLTCTFHDGTPLSAADVVWSLDQQTATTQTESNRLLQQAARQVAEDGASDWLYLAQRITVARQGIYGVPQAETSNRYNLATLAVGA